MCSGVRVPSWRFWILRLDRLASWSLSACLLDTLLLSVGPMLLLLLLRNRNPLLPQSGKVNVSITHHYKYT